MVDEITLQREVTLGNKAKALLENDILNASWNEIEAGLIQKWINTSLEDVAVREETWHLLRANRRQRQLLQQHVANGTVSKADLEKRYADVERRKKFGEI
jgi:hypothetical protein